MPQKATLSIARRGRVITKSMFNGYDLCINPYVGCEFGCSYCYVRFSVKDDNHEWGEFVRVRDHLSETLPKELNKGYFHIEDSKIVALGDDGSQLRTTNGKLSKKTIYRDLPMQDARLVIGTMTDPYQPAEKKYRITRQSLEIITNHSNQFKKVGIFTRSPLVLQDLDLIKRLPQARVHFTVTPFQPDVLRAIEPYSPISDRRWDVVRQLKEAGLRVHVNISPIIPVLSDGFEEDFVNKLIEYQVDEYFVDPMQSYKESWDAFKLAAANLTNVDFPAIEHIMLDKDRYVEWKGQYLQRWNSFREQLQHKAPNQLPIWSDHINRVWVNMLTGRQMSKRKYAD